MPALGKWYQSLGVHVFTTWQPEKELAMPTSAFIEKGEQTFTG